MTRICSASKALSVGAAVGISSRRWSPAPPLNSKLGIRKTIGDGNKPKSFTFNLAELRNSSSRCDKAMGTGVRFWRSDLKTGSFRRCRRAEHAPQTARLNLPASQSGVKCLSGALRTAIDARKRNEQQDRVASVSRTFAVLCLDSLLSNTRDSEQRKLLKREPGKKGVIWELLKS